jgi:hypothetical protein
MQRVFTLTLMLLIAVLALVPVSAQSHTPASPHANPPTAETTQADAAPFLVKDILDNPTPISLDHFPPVGGLQVVGDTLSRGVT